ncbi:hypothetical protein GJ25_gp048 [Mycobacterium phage Hawkeye]|uniref:Uncharacterized protein n=1 Tax=Mycobacterium phage Hawkeye TaxID=1458711 RepID=X2KYV1_9CAUD|nr:hypothetical protein GJ25_gp048 [Mycobacterium phage Hawkeye]AHN84059.1 hypothetical protein PBI_HAWKEYE_48 [Mycobacterium phage Hawkeye]
MPVTTTNQRAEVAEIAAKNGWNARDFSLPRGTTAGATVKVEYRRGQTEIVTVMYNHLDKLVTSIGSRYTDEPGQIMLRLVTLMDFLKTPPLTDEVENWPTIETRKNSAIARRQDPETREWRETGRATAHSNEQGEDRQWWVYLPGVKEEVAVFKNMPEPRMRAAVLAVLRELA